MDGPRLPSGCRSIVAVPTTAAGGSARIRARCARATRPRDVVRVHPGEERRAGSVEADIERPGEAERLRVPRHADARPRSRRVFPRGVHRTVVDEDELEIRVRLAEDAPHCLVDRRLGVAGGHHDGHERGGHGGLRVACAGGGSRLRPRLRPRRRNGRPDRRAATCSTRSSAGPLGFRLVVVDQNADERCRDVLARHSAGRAPSASARSGACRGPETPRCRTYRDLVAFPTDDCTYPPGLLARVARRFAGRSALDGLPGGRRGGRRHPPLLGARGRPVLTPANLWNRVISYGIFLRRESSGGSARSRSQPRPRSGALWSSGEEVEYVAPCRPRGRADRVRPEPDRPPCGQGATPGASSARSGRGTAPASAGSPPARLRARRPRG